MPESLIITSKNVQKLDKATFVTPSTRMTAYKNICDRMSTLGELSTDLVNPKKERKNIKVDSIIRGTVTVFSDSEDEKAYYFKVIKTLVDESLAKDFLKTKVKPNEETENMIKRVIVSGLISDWIIIHQSYCAKFKA